MKRKKQPMIGIILILAGVFLLFSRKSVIHLSWSILLWIVPIILFGLGLIFHIIYFSRPYRRGGILVPAGMFLIYGIFFSICIYSNNWGMIKLLWPLFPLGIAMGLLEYHFFGRAPHEVLIPAVILCGISIIFIGINLNEKVKGYVLPVILILLGLFIAFNNTKRKKFF